MRDNLTVSKLNHSKNKKHHHQKLTKSTEYAGQLPQNELPNFKWLKDHNMHRSGGGLMKT